MVHSIALESGVYRESNPWTHAQTQALNDNDDGFIISYIVVKRFILSHH